MAKLYFRYSTMNAGKSIDILKTHYNYLEQNKDCMLLSSSLDNRFGEGIIASRIGVQADALMFTKETDIWSLVVENVKEHTYCILVDEAQFLTKEQVEQLANIVDELNIPVIAYGLLTDFQSQLFEGSKRLIELAEKKEELKTICWKCKQKAMFNLRILNGVPVFDGEQVAIGENADKAKEDEVAYYPVCRKHYVSAKKKGVFGV